MKPIGLGLIAALAASLTACERVGDPEPIAQGSDLVKRDNRALNGAEIQAYLQNSTLVHEGSQRIWYVYLRENGTLAGRSDFKDGGGVEYSHGTWEVVNDQLCRQWSSDWAGGGRGCATVYQNGEEYVFKGGDGTEIRRTRLPGNPKLM